MAFNIPNGAFRLSAEEASGQPNYQAALQNAFKNSQAAVDTAYKPKNMAEALLQAQLKNKHDSIINQFLPESEQARIAETQANTGLIGQNTLKQKILNEYLPQREPAEIAELTARGNYYNQGKPGYSGVGGAAERDFQSNVKLDNPGLTDDEYRDAVNAIRSGETTLPDGRPIKVTPTTMEALNRVVKAGTTANLINQSVKANQGESELKALDEYQKTFENPYQSTVMGISPQLLSDSFNKSKEAQKRFGQYIGLQALNYEKAQVRNNIAGGTPGITAINELMNHSGQIIKNKYPNISASAREEADRVISEGIERMRKARVKAGFSPSSINKKEAMTTKKSLQPVAAGKVRVFFPDGPHVIPAKLLKDAIKSGATLEQELPNG